MNALRKRVITLGEGRVVADHTEGKYLCRPDPCPSSSLPGASSPPAKHVVRNVWLALSRPSLFLLALMSVNVLVGIHALLEQSVRILERKVDLAGALQARDAASRGGPNALFLVFAWDRGVRRRHSRGPGARCVLRSAMAKFGTLGRRRGTRPEPAWACPRREGQEDVRTIRCSSKPKIRSSASRSSRRKLTTMPMRSPWCASSGSRCGGSAARSSPSSPCFLPCSSSTPSAWLSTPAREIGVMRLVGASNPYIRLPFLLEGLFLAALSVAIAAGVSFACGIVARSILAPMFGGEGQGLLPYFLLGAPMGLAPGRPCLGSSMLLSSWAAVSRYLRVESPMSPRSHVGNIVALGRGVRYRRVWRRDGVPGACGQWRLR